MKSGQISILFRAPKEGDEHGSRFFSHKTLLLYLAALLMDSAAFPLAQIFMSLAEKRLVNAVEFRNPSWMNEVVLYCVLVFLLIFFLNSIAEYQKEKQTTLFMMRLKRRFAQKLMLLPPDYQNGRDNGDLITRMNGDMDHVSELYTWSLHRFFLAIFYGGGSVLLMILLCWQLSLVILCLALFETACLGRLSGRIQKFSENIRENRARGTDLFLSLLGCLKSIRMLSLHDVMYRKYSAVHADITQNSEKLGDRIALMNAVSDLTGSINLLCALAAGTVLYFSGMVDLGTVMAFLTVQDGISYMFSNLKNFFSSLRKYEVSLSRIYEILDFPLSKGAASEKNPMPVNNNLSPSRITCRNLSFRYASDSEYILRNVTFTAESGDIIAITGPSGTGKSTLARLLAGLCQPTEGEILYDDIPGSQLPPGAVCVFTAYVPQFPYLFHASITENIRGGTADSGNSGLSVASAALLADAASFIDARDDGYASPVLRNGNNLSGGQKQRIALARAFFSDKRVLILDESTSALDSDSEEKVIASLRKEAAKGKIIFLISHKERLNAACSRVLHLNSLSAPDTA